MKRFLKDQSGASVIEFTMLFPLFIVMIFGTFEAGWLMTKHMWVERGLDVAMRDVRLGNVEETSYEDIRDRICEYIGGVNNCSGNIILTADVIELGGPVDQSPTECVDRADDGAGVYSPSDGFSVDGNSNLVLMKLCVIVDPLIPNFGLALLLPLDESGGYRIRAASAFLNEPGGS